VIDVHTFKGLDHVSRRGAAMRQKILELQVCVEWES